MCSVLAWTLGAAPQDKRLIAAIAAGAAIGFLPWLHVRFLVVSLVLVAWAAIRAPRRTALVLSYAVARAALCGYADHITGSLRPDALYAVEGAESAWIPAEARQSSCRCPSTASGVSFRTRSSTCSRFPAGCCSRARHAPSPSVSPSSLSRLPFPWPVTALPPPAPHRFDSSQRSFPCC